MESLLEVLIGLYFVTEVEETEAEMEANEKEYQLLWSVIENTEIEDLFHEAIYWIEYECGDISEEIYRLMTDANFG